jgi:hypothetical protein
MTIDYGGSQIVDKQQPAHTIENTIGNFLIEE